MLNFRWKNWVVPLYLLLALLLDGTFSLNFQQIVHNTHVNASINLTMIGFVLLALDDDQNKKIIYLGLGFGLVSDWFYYGFLGYSFFLLPLTILAVQYISKAVPFTFTARLIVVLLVTFCWQVYQFILYNFFGLGQVGLLDFITSGLPFSLVLSLILTILTYALWNHLILKYPFFQVKVN